MKRQLYCRNSRECTSCSSNHGAPSHAMLSSWVKCAGARRSTRVSSAVRRGDCCRPLPTQLVGLFTVIVHPYRLDPCVRCGHITHVSQHPAAQSRKQPSRAFLPQLRRISLSTRPALVCKSSPKHTSHFTDRQVCCCCCHPFSVRKFSETIHLRTTIDSGCSRGMRHLHRQ